MAMLGSVAKRIVEVMAQHIHFATCAVDNVPEVSM